MTRTMIALLSRARTAAARAAPANAPVARHARWMSDEGSIREGGGTFGRKGKAVEDKFIYEHDKELLKQMQREKEAQASKPAPPKAPKAPAPAAPKAPKAPSGPFDPRQGGPIRSGGSHGAYNERESAFEDKFIYDRERELFNKSKPKK